MSSYSTIVLRCPPELKSAIQAESEAIGVSVNRIIIAALEVRGPVIDRLKAERVAALAGLGVAIPTPPAVTSEPKPAKKSGLCRECGNPALPKRRLCASCKAKHDAEVKRAKAALRPDDERM